MEDKLRTFLRNDAGVAAEYGDRIYANVLKQGSALPALVYQRIDTPRTAVHGERSTFPRPRIQMTTWAKTYKAAKRAASAVREALDGYRGTMGGVVISRIAILNEHDGYDPETGLNSFVQDYQVTYKD